MVVASQGIDVDKTYPNRASIARILFEISDKFDLPLIKVVACLCEATYLERTINDVARRNEFKQLYDKEMKTLYAYCHQGVTFCCYKSSMLGYNHWKFVHY